MEHRSADLAPQAVEERRILVVEDDPDLAHLTRLHLEHEGFGVQVEADGRGALLAARSGAFDLVVLDLMLPGLDGLDVCRTLRRESAYVPIIVVTARGSETDRILGLELGADDYLSKPVSLRELSARVRAMFRRMDALEDRSDDADVLVRGRLEIDRVRRNARLNGASVDLTAKEFELLVHFASKPGQGLHAQRAGGRPVGPWLHGLRAHGELAHQPPAAQDQRRRATAELHRDRLGSRLSLQRAPRMMSLRARLTAVLLALFLAVGTILLIGMMRGSRMYFEEVHHKLNRDVAHHIAKSLDPFVPRGSEEPGARGVKQEVLQGLFMDVMNINPSLEVYLLDVDGRILAFDAPEGHVKRERVDLAPVKAALAAPAGATAPRGDDPRGLDRRKPFSAAELRTGGELAGYLYVILGGEAHERVAATLGESAMLRGSAILLAGSIALAGLVGTICIVLLVRPLRRLRDAMVTLQQAERRRGPDAAGRDEVEDLSASFDAMAQRIADQIEELEEKDRRRREFVANVSHDLRTPAGVIQGYLETLTLRWEQLEAGEREQFLRSALRQAERLGSLVDQLFELTHLEAREFEPRKESFSLAELVQDVVAKFQGAARKKGVRLEASVGYDIPPIFADIALLERALDNLIDNAIRYTSPEGTVRVELTHVAGGVGLSVRDSGPGIADEDLPKIFDRFYRVERGAAEGAGGTGLGLAIAKRIVDLHEGSIEVQSDVGQGTVFSFVLAPC